MSIKVEKNGDKLFITPEGRIDSVTAPEFGQKIDENIEGVKNLTLDFINLPYISSAGLRVLLSTHKRMKETNGQMKLINVSEVVMEVFNITGFADIFQIE